MRYRRQFIKHQELDEGSEINTVYGDLVTFIMCLFILLFVLSYQEKPSYNSLFSEIRLEFGGETETIEEKMTAEALFISEVEGYLKDENLEDQAEVTSDDQMIKIVLNPPVLFDTGRAIMKPEGKRILNGLGNLLKEVMNPIIVEGHTDNVPIHNDIYDSNWDLSFDRSYKVIKYFINTMNMSPKRLSSLGYGEYRPIAPNDTPEHRSKNRRIEINVMKGDKIVSETRTLKTNENN